MLKGTRFALLICGDKWTEERGPSLLGHFWHRPEFKGLRGFEYLSREKAALRALHPWQGGVGIYGFYQVDDIFHDIIDGIPYLIPYTKKEKPGEHRAFFLGMSDRFATLFRFEREKNLLVAKEICRI